MEATFQLPESLLDELQERSRIEGRSVDAVAEDALRRGLEDSPALDHPQSVRMSVAARPTLEPFNDESLRRLEEFWRELPDGARTLSEGLDWARGDQPED